MIRIATIAAALLMLAAPAFADQRDEDISRLEAINAARKIAQRGRAADERVITNGKLNDKDLAEQDAVLAGIETTVTDWKQRSDWTGAILGIGGSLLGLGGIGMFARSRIKAAQNLAASTLRGIGEVVQPAQDAGRPFLASAPTSSASSQGSGEVRDAHPGGHGSDGDPRTLNDTVIDRIVNLPSGEWEVAQQQRAAAKTNGSNGN